MQDDEFNTWQSNKLTLFTSIEAPAGSLAYALQKIQHKARFRRDIFVSFLKWSITVSLIWTSNLLPCEIFPS